MRIRMLTCSVGRDFVRSAGEVLDLPDVEAGRLIAAGQAEAVKDAATSRRGAKRTAENPAAKSLEATKPPEA